MKFCPECGTRLELKELLHEGIIPYCPHCKEFRFPTFSTAVSMVIINRKANKTLLIKQYGKSFNRLVAGYINKGESAEEALVREMNEEIGLTPQSFKFQESKYFPKSNTLLFNFLVYVDSMDIKPNYEIDSYGWYDIDSGYEALEGASLARVFYKYYLDNNKN